MLFNHNGKQYRLDFAYSVDKPIIRTEKNAYGSFVSKREVLHLSGPVALANTHNTKVVTYAMLSERMGPGEYEPIDHDFTVRNPKDIFSKVLARKIVVGRLSSRIAKDLAGAMVKSFNETHKH